MLAVSGYFAHWRYAQAHGDRAVETLQRLLRLSLARKLAPLIGRKLALFTALALAGAGFAFHRAQCLPLRDNVRFLLMAASTLAGTAAICIDSDRAERYARAIEPLTALGPDHAATVVHTFSWLMSMEGRERPAYCVERLQGLIARLASTRPIHEMFAADRSSYHAGAHFALGAFLVRLDNREGLEIADTLERFSPLYAMTADHLRAFHYAGQGDVHNTRFWRRKVEVHAVQLGSAWQAEIWSPVDMIAIAWRLDDATELKRAAQALARLGQELPSLAHQEQIARIGYLVLRGKYAAAIELGQSCSEPSFVGSMRVRGALARAHNALGQHERARELCLGALAEAAPEDLQYVVTHLGLPIELALAEAGLGRVRLAHDQLQALALQHAPNRGAVTLGLIEEARARVCLLERDFAGARMHLNLAHAQFKTLSVASLIGRVRALARAIAHDEQPESAAPAWLERTLDDARPMNQRTVDPERVHSTLQVALRLCGAETGFVLMAGDDTRVAAYAGDDPPGPELLSWVRQQLLDTDTDLESTVSDELSSQSEPMSKVFGGLRYTAVPLWASRAGSAIKVAALALGFDDDHASPPGAEELRIIAAHLNAANDL